MTAVTIYDPSKTHFYVQLEEDITRILVTSEDKTIDEVKKTSSDFKVFIAAIQAKFVVLVKENQKLSELLIASKSRVREITVLHTEVLSVIKEDIDLKKRELLTIQQEMIAYVQKAKEHINKEIDAKIKAIEAAHQAGKVRESTAHQDLKDAQLQLKTIIDEDAEQAIVKLTEKDAAVQAAEQTGAAKLAAVQQEEDALRRDIANLKKSHADKLAAEIALQASDTIRMQQFCDQFTIVSNWHANLSHRAVGINYIHYELKSIIARRQADTIYLGQRANYYKQGMYNNELEWFNIHIGNMIVLHQNPHNKAYGEKLQRDLKDFINERKARN